MFSKLLAFGLGALTVVRAAPALSFENQLLSCSVSLDKPIAPVNFFEGIVPGNYLIYNEAYENSELRAYALNERVFVRRTLEYPGPFGTWWVQPSGNPGSNEYTISNVGLGAPTEGSVVTTQGQGDSFAIEPAGDGTFTIKVSNEDKVWTVIPGLVASPVRLKPQVGAVAAKWRLVPSGSD